MIRKELHEENRLAWNEATTAHNSHKQDQARFLREGGTTLFPEELELLGDLQGKTLLHLQCNAGQDTLSLAKHGAVVTGVDISDTAITFARQLGVDAGIPAIFHRMDVYDWLAQAANGTQRWDRVFASYGFIFWLSDITTWAQGIANVLKPGGHFAMIEFHPFAMMFEEDWTLKFNYFNANRVMTSEVGIGDYVAEAGTALAPSGYQEGIQNFQNPHRSHEFPWAISEVITALLGAGLTLTTFREYPFANGCRQFLRMRELPGNRVIAPADIPEMPLMYGLAAQKPA